MKNFKRTQIVGFGLIWVALLALGIGALERYTLTPGKLGTISTSWPDQSKLKRFNQPTLLVFLHPECACSEATVSELDKIMAKIPMATTVYVLFVQPEGWSEEETKSNLWQRASKIPKLEVVLDESRLEAKLFGALTSGHTLVYGQDGQLAFSGGITGARGHQGDNEGEDAVVEILKNQKNIRLAQTKIFGCGLFEK